ncbi:histidine phosphatase family protein [Pseudalkalibacillus hwajinpoensis]|uniref:histidine phosphatase family protein n=1 Tax=Guptibacillus hwajinpoensis TaxID=208199 RepID=UPI001CFEABBF|nr:histidine phosphatase family protein [Pseudalkalibacillus hwajinpoensis]
MRIYLTRHGETKWNKENRLQGWKDSDLTTIGEKNATALGLRLKEIDINKIYTSPSVRAVHTANLIRGSRDIRIQKVEELREIYFGLWEGRTKESIVAEYKSEYHHFWNSPHLYNPSNHEGESLQDLQTRVLSALHMIIDQDESRSVLIVTHAVVIRVLLSYVLALSFEELWKPPFIHGASLTILEYDEGEFEVKGLGDTNHLIEV